MDEINLKSIVSLLKDEDSGLYNIKEIYHALIEYIKSGQAISDIGHPKFMAGARRENDNVYPNNYPKPQLYFLTSIISKYLSNFKMEYIWYRDLSSWEKFCKYIVELKQVKYFERNNIKVIKSSESYVNRIICPACGTQRYNARYDRTNEVYLDKKDHYVHINCSHCGKYIMPQAAFKYLDTFEKKAKLYVYLATRVDRDKKYELISTTILRKEILV